MPNLNVTYQDMEEAANRLENGQTEIESKLDELQKQVKALVDGGYVTDTSSKQFETSYMEFNDGARKVISGLEGMGKFLKKAASTFKDADEQLAKGLNQG